MITNTFLQSYHNSFQPVLDRIPERGMYSPYAHIMWWPPWSNHGHAVQLGDQKGYNILRDGGSLEEVAEELAEMVSNCHADPDRHNGNIKHNHRSNEADEAYKDGIEQLQTVEYDRHFAHSMWLQAMHKKWGGPIPAGMILPTTSLDEWQLMIPDYQGDPVIYNMQPEVAKDFVGMEPPDRESLQKDETLGFKYALPSGQTTDQKLRVYRKLAERNQKLTR